MKGDNMKNKMDPVGNFVRYGSSSSKWTVFFTLIAVFSILAVSVAQVSFALPDDDFPTTLTDTEIDEERQLNDPSGNNGVPHGGIALKYAHKPDGTKVPVYCLEVWKDYGNGSTYNRVDEKTLIDNGVIALLTYAHKTVFPGIESDLESASSKQNQAIVQLALWAYLYDTNATVKQMSQQDEAITDESRAKIDSGTWGTRVKQLVDYAKAHAAEYGDPVVTIEKSGDWELSEDGDYLLSPKMTINATPSGALENFEIYVDNAPGGTKVLVNNQGRTDEWELSELSSATFSNAVNIQLKVPKNQVTEKSRTIYIDATGNYNYYVGYEYTNGNSGDQRIVAGGVQGKSATSTVEEEVQYKVEVPETAQDSSMALYIIGLIVLLCGAGVIYANVKPAKEK